VRIDAIELHVGEPDFPYEPIRQLEAKSEARTAFSSPPTHDAVNAQLRDLAARANADAVIRIEYNKGISMTSWNSLKGKGLAVRRLGNGPADPPSPARGLGQPAARHTNVEPLKSSDNNSMPIIILGIIGALIFLVAVFTS